MTTHITESTIHNAFRLILAEKENKALNYCVAYARAGLDLTGHELYIQCLYVLNNMTQWRGAAAKEVRQTLKTFIKQEKRQHER